MENVKVEGNNKNNNNSEVYLTAIQCEGVERAQVSHGMIQKWTFMDMVMIPGGLTLTRFQDYLRKTHMYEVSMLVSVLVENVQAYRSHLDP